MAFEQWIPSNLCPPASTIPKNKRIEYMVSNALKPIPEHKFDTIYSHLFSEPFTLPDFGRFCTITELIASIPNLYRTISSDGRAFIHSYKDNQNRSLSNCLTHKVPKWSVRPSNKRQIFGSMSIIFKIFKGNRYVRDIDLLQCLMQESDKSYILFGRDELTDFCVQHMSISRKHAVLQFANDGGLYLFDASTHGTLLNNSKTPHKKYVELKNKDKIRFGQSSRTYILYMNKGGKRSETHTYQHVEHRTDAKPENEALLQRQNEQQQNKINEMQQMIEKLKMDLNGAQKTATDKSRKVMALMEKMECLQVKDFEAAQHQNDSSSRCSSEEKVDLEPKRVTKIKGIDFLKEVNNLSKLTVVKLKYYTDKNEMNVSRVKKAELVKIIQKDIKRHFRV